MQCQPTSLPEVKRIVPQVFADKRGFFFEVWRESLLREQGISASFVQENHSRSQQGVLRGLHYQIQQAQGKLVRVVAGEIWDVAVDLRRSSSTFGRWTYARLSSENRHMLWVPPGFGHGFLVTGQWAEMVYLCTDIYAPEHERTIRWDDPELGIQWPLGGTQPLISNKDAQGMSFAQAEVYP